MLSPTACEWLSQDVSARAFTLYCTSGYTDGIADSSTQDLKASQCHCWPAPEPIGVQENPRTQGPAITRGRAHRTLGAVDFSPFRI